MSCQLLNSNDYPYYPHVFITFVVLLKITKLNRIYNEFIDNRDGGI
jgi:hypothetical protein